jgi:hypothetical protein
MTEDERLLRKLAGCIRTTNLDMGGDHRYILRQEGHKVVTEIKEYLYEKDLYHE